MQDIRLGENGKKYEIMNCVICSLTITYGMEMMNESRFMVY